MTCPRCDHPTDRIGLRSWPAVGVFAMGVTLRDELICDSCLADWEIRRALKPWTEGGLQIIGPHKNLILPPKGAICGRPRTNE